MANINSILRQITEINEDLKERKKGINFTYKIKQQIDKFLNKFEEEETKVSGLKEQASKLEIKVSSIVLPNLHNFDTNMADFEKRLGTQQNAEITIPP